MGLPEGSFIHKTPVTWILVADGRHAQVYMRHRVKTHIPMGSAAKHRYYDERYAPDLLPVKGMNWQAESAQEYEFSNDTLGRVFESVGGAHHKSLPHMTVHTELKLRFMRTIASQLEIAHRDDLFDRLVLIAPPRLLGELKAQLDKRVLACVIAELPKEMTRYKTHDLARQLEEMI